jgi:hypothetical protein
MSLDPRDLDTLRHATRATPERVDAVVEGVDATIPSAAQVTRALAHLPPVPEGAAARVKGAVLARDPRPMPSGGGLGAWIGGGAAALLTLGGLVAALGLGSGPEALRGPVDPGAIELVIAADGTGTLSGSTDRPEITWEAGTLTLAGPALITTREAHVASTGPATLTRDVAGTRITGPAQVTCRAPDVAAPRSDGDTLACPPVSAAGRLALARSRDDAGAPPAEVLALLDDGLAVASSPVVTAELRAARIATLADLGRDRDLLEAARQHLRDPEAPRAREVAHRAAATALAAGDCDAARPFLQALPDDPQARAALDACATRD